MKILKYRKATSPSSKISIRNKCKCGTKVLLNELTDLYASGENVCAQTGFLEMDFVLEFGYICPGCEKFTPLDEKKSLKVNRYLEKQGFDLKWYHDRLWESNFGMFINPKDGSLMDRAAQDKYDSDLYYELMEKGLPLSLKMYEKYIKGR